MERRSSGAVIAAGLLMLLQAAIAALSGLGLLASARRLQRFTFAAGIAHHRAGAGLVLVILAVAAAVIAGFMLGGAGPARIAAYAFEAVAVVAAMLRLGRHPLLAILGAGVAMLVIVLIASAGDGETSTRSRPEGRAEPGVGGAP